MLLLCVVYDTFGIYALSRKKLRDVVTGILVGLIGVAVMLNPWSIEPGVFFDTRWVLLSLCGLFFGLVPTAIAVMIAGAFRLYQGGAGWIVGTVVIVVTAGVGVGWKYWRDKKQTPVGWKELYAFGVVVQLAMLSCMFLMPANMIFPILKAVAPPVLSIFPVLTLIIGLILKRQEARRDAEKELVENRKVLIKERGLLRGVINSISDMIFYKDTSGKYLGCNRSFESFTGLEAQNLIGKTDRDLFAGENFDFFSQLDMEILTTGNSVRLENLVLTREGKSLLLETVKTPFRGLDGTLHGLVSISRDITERKHAEEEREKLQEQLIQAQKMESVGRLAGGVAHDFNNMLGVILGQSELALSRLEPTQPLYSNLQEICKAANRSADLTRQLLAFARKQTVAPKVLDLNKTVGGMIEMMQRLIGEDIRLSWFPGVGLWPVKIDPTQIDQILANLCVNARDAILDTGKITIETGIATIDEAHHAMHSEAVPGDYVTLVVSDTGCGIDHAILSRLFEPFFTTKEIGKGTGLGLATVYGIVQQNNGFISVHSEPGQGASFEIYLPRYEGETDQMPEGSKMELPVRGHETILIAEDESMVLQMTKRMLEMQGYKVLTADKPSKAIQMAQEYIDEIHLLLTDVVMPDMNGRDLARKLLSYYPQLKTLFMSGYTANVIAHHGVLDDSLHFIQKPFKMDNLTVKIREVLDQYPN